jgi:hypothetical protein
MKAAFHTPPFSKENPMNESHSRAGEKARTRRLAILAAMMFALAGGIFGGSAYLQRKAERTVLANQPKRPWQDPVIEKQLRAARLAKAKKIREKFRPLALKHKALIKKMRAAQPDDEAAMMAVWNVLPSYSEEIGLTSRELGSTRPFFSWATMVRKYPLKGQPHWEEWIEKAKEAYAIELRKDFREQRDIVVSDSVNAGPYNVKIWISGRITEEARIDNPSPTPGGPAFVDAPSQEVAPAYDFIAR